MKPGDLVTCANGHLICEIAKPLSYGDKISPDCFHNWCQGMKPPLNGERVKPCPDCGADYIRVGNLNLGYQVHINGEWRP